MKQICVLLGALSSGICFAQITSPHNETTLFRQNVQSAKVLANGTPADIVLPVTEGPISSQSIEVIISDPATQVSLILPNGTVLAPQDGTSSNGLTFHTYSVDPGSSGTTAPTPLLNTLFLPGMHIVVEFSGAALSGQYTVRSVGSIADSSVSVIQLPPSGPSLGALTDVSTYRQGDTVIVSALIFNGNTPVTQASMQATIVGLLAVSGTITNYQLVGQQQISNTRIQDTYSVQFVNTGSALSEVIATATVSDTQSTLIDGGVAFWDVPSNGTVTGVKTFTIERPISVPFTPATLSWKIRSPGPASTIPLTDSGTYDAQSGDGVFTGTFTPTEVGEYFAQISSSLGTSASDRSATASFVVVPTRALFASFHENVYTQQGLINQIDSVATLNVTQPGVYSYEMQLKASNGVTIRSQNKTGLAAGTQDIAVHFPADQLSELGGDGPWERIEAQLVYSPDFDPEITDYRQDAGATEFYALSSLARTPPYLTGQNQFQGINANGAPGFELLRAQIGILAPGGSCIYSAGLTDSAGTSIDFVSSSVTVPDLAPSYLVLDFSGAKISRAGPSPYHVVGLTADCNGSVSSDDIAIDGFNATQFESASPALAVTISPGSRTIMPGQQTTYHLSTSGAGGFEGNVDLTVSGLPAGALGTINFPHLSVPGATDLIVTTGTSSPAGTYTLTVSAQSGSLNASAMSTLVLVVPGTPPSGNSVAPSSGSGTAGDFAFIALAPTAGTAVVGVGIGLDGPGYGPGRCYFSFKAGSGSLYLLNDAGQGWLGPVVLAAPGDTPQNPSVLSNNQCSVDSGQSWALFSVDRTYVQLQLDVAFAGGFAGEHLWYLQVQDSSDVFSNWTQIGDWNVTAAVSAPTFDPGAGTYASAQSVTISTTTSGASIRYTTDGSSPTPSNGTLYSGPVSVNTTTTLKAIAYASGMADSAVTSAVFTILPPVATPTFSPTAGTYASAQNVTISTTTSGASIRYTTDGSIPSSSTGTVYTGPITVGVNTTIKAIAYAGGLTDSAVASATYTIQVATPAFSPGAGTYGSPQTVTISTPTTGATIRYTTDGSTPSSSSGTIYSAPVSVSASATLKAIAYTSGMADSDIGSANYTILPPVATPTFSPVAGTYAGTQTVTISTTTSGASIRYTTDGSTPTSTTGTLYSAPVTVSATTTIKAIGYMMGVVDSAIATAAFTIQAAAPTFSPIQDSYPTAQTVTINTATPGVSIRYTTNGVAPTSTLGNLYSGPITFGQTTTFMAIAYGPGVMDSAVSSATMTITSIISPQGVATVATSGFFDVLAVPVQSPTTVNTAAWSVINDQDDLEWSTGTDQGGGVWKGSVNLSHHQSATVVDYGLIGVHVHQYGGPSGDLFLGSADLSRYIPNFAVVNPGFETGSLSSWSTFSTATNAKTTAAAHTGSYGLSQASGDGGVFQDFDGLLPGNVYTVRAWVKSPDATAPPVELWLHDTTGNNIIGSGTITPSGSWQQLTVNYIANSIGRLRIHLVRHTGSGSAYWDDVSVSSPALNNPGFETGSASSWTTFSGVQGSTVSSPVLTGTKSYSLVSGEGGLFQDVSGLTPGLVYTIEAWARASSTSTADLFVHDTTGGGSVTTGNVNLDTNWKHLSVSFTATATGAMRVHLHRGTSGSTVYWDDVVVRNPH